MLYISSFAVSTTSFAIIMGSFSDGAGGLERVMMLDSDRLIKFFFFSQEFCSSSVFM